MDVLIAILGGLAVLLVFGVVALVYGTDSRDSIDDDWAPRATHHS